MADFDLGDLKAATGDHKGPIDAEPAEAVNFDDEFNLEDYGGQAPVDEYGQEIPQDFMGNPYEQ